MEIIALGGLKWVQPHFNKGKIIFFIGYWVSRVYVADILSLRFSGKKKKKRNKKNKKNKSELLEEKFFN